MTQIDNNAKRLFDTITVYSMTEQTTNLIKHLARGAIAGKSFLVTEQEGRPLTVEEITDAKENFTEALAAEKATPDMVAHFEYTVREFALPKSGFILFSGLKEIGLYFENCQGELIRISV